MPTKTKTATELVAELRAEALRLRTLSERCLEIAMIAEGTHGMFNNDHKNAK